MAAHRLVLGLTLLSFAVVGLVPAATVHAEDRQYVIEEIIVTARKREETAQSVPIPITALSEELTKSTIRDMTDLNGFAPNVTIGRDSSRSGAASVTIRGISPTRTDDNSFDSPIGIMIDGIYLGSLAGQILENFDLERVEVLRGPQGTLFGKNTVGGVVHVIRSRPTGEPGAKIKATIGKWDRREFRGVFNLPVVDETLAAKLFFTSIQDDGFMKHVDGGRMPEKDYQNYGVTFLWNPTDNFEALFTAERFVDDSQGAAFLTNFNLAPGVSPAPSDPRQQDLSGGFLACTLFNSGAVPTFNSGVPCRTDLSKPSSTSLDTRNPYELDTEAYTLTMSWDLNDNWRLVSTTGFREQVEDRKYDFDGTEADHITIDRKNDYEQFSEELRIEGTWDNLSIVAGAYYWDSEFTQDWVTGGEFWKFVGTLSGYDLSDNTWILGGALVPPAGGVRDAFDMGLSPLEGCFALMFGNVRCDTRSPLTGMGPGLIQELFETQKTESTALFFQADWTFAENWTLTAGLRWTEEKKDFVAGQAYLGPKALSFDRNFPDFVDLDNKWDEISPKVGLSYQMTDDVLVYASYTEGFHSGGFFGVNQNIADFLRNQYDPEFSKNYEVGVKSQLMDNRLQLNASYFFNDFEDKQEESVQFDGSTNTVATVFSNAAAVTYQGIEVEAQFVVNQYAKLFATFGWLDAEYDEFETDINPNDDALAGPSIVDATFLTPRNAPEFTYGLGGTLNFVVGQGEIEVFGKYSYVDEFESDLLNLDVGRVSDIEDLSASIAYVQDNWRITLFGRNLTDEQSETPAIIAPLFASGTLTPGTSWGVDFTINFE